MDEQEQEPEGPLEIAIVGDLTESEAELTDKLLAVEPGGECTLYFDSPGGSPYCAMSLTSLIHAPRLASHGHCHRRMLLGRAVAVCRLQAAVGHALQRDAVSSDEMAKRRACRPARSRRMGAALRTVGNRHGSVSGDLFGQAKADIQQWITSHRYVSGPELAAAGLAEMIDFKMLEMFHAGAGQGAGQFCRL